MKWKFSIQTNEPGDPATSWPSRQSDPPTSIWAVGSPPNDDSGDWLIGLHFAVRGGHPVLVEQRTFPDERLAATYAFNRWSGDEEAVPDGGLPAAVVKNLALLSMENQVRAALANHREPAWGGGPPSGYSDGEPPENLSDWMYITEIIGVDTGDTGNQRKRGRPPLPDELLAEVAFHYTEASRQGNKRHLYIGTRMRGTGTTRSNAGQRIKKARDRGFLSPTDKQGRAGGTITQKAIDTLKRSGFLSSKGEPVNEQEGTTE